MKISFEIDLATPVDPLAITELLAWAQRCSVVPTDFGTVTSVIASGKKTNGAAEPVITVKAAEPATPAVQTVEQPVADPPAPANRRGRPPKVQTAAAATEAMTEPPAPAPVPPSSYAIPPGMAPQPQAQPTQTNGTTTVEDVRAAMVELNKSDSTKGLGIKIMRAATWADGTPKASWVTVENIPAEFRGRVIEEAMQAAL